jgi:pullulanase
MYAKFGARVEGSSVDFHLFIPDATQYRKGGSANIRRLQVVGDFQPLLGGEAWDYTHAPEMAVATHTGGMLYSLHLPLLPDGFYQYKYFVTYHNGTTRWCGDPCSKYVATAHENAAFVIGGNDMQVEPLRNPRPLADLVIYELMLDDFTAAFRGNKAPVDAMLDKLDYLRELGVNTLEFMPWTAWRGGEFSWGYNPFLFFAVENRYIEDSAEPLDRLYRLKRLINAAHQRGMQVVMDGVFNHVDAGLTPDRGFPYHWLYQNPEDSPFTGGFAQAGYFEELDYNNACTQQFIFDVCQYWLDEFQLDGIRFDYTLGFYQPDNPDHGLGKLMRDLQAYLAETNRQHVALMIEHLSDNRYEAIDVANRTGATGCWYDRFLFDVPQQASSGRTEPGLMRLLDSQRDFAPGKGPVTYVENHDHSSLANRVGGRERAWWKMQAPLLALFTTPGAVLLHNGQEFADDYHLPGEGDGRVIPRPLHWEYAEDGIGRWMRSLHQQLARMRREHPALLSAHFYPDRYEEGWTHFNPQGYGVDTDNGLAIYHRWGESTNGRLERFIIVLNFSGVDRYVNVPFSVNGIWQELLSGETYRVENYQLSDQQINAHWGRIFYEEHEP